MPQLENSRRAREIFEAAIEISATDERATYVKEVCGDDAALRQRVEALLGANDQAESFLPNAPEDHIPEVILTENPGDRIGRYKLLEKIGEGGMGIVYMAEQEEPVRRRVALKIIKLGMDTKQVVARFEAERQALALMDHPHIAKVLDAGATDGGRPFFVMELVQGLPLTRFCDENQFSPEERIKLFIPVCQAIQSAHQKGIIHRDLKPSNVLVTLNAGVPHPMVIDFGVAKAINQKLTEKTLFTNFATMIGTPAYMSPEQAEMSKLDVDTRSDIYSLGVLLYELLTDTTPFSEERLRSVSHSEMQRIIVQEEPERPSTRLKKTIGGQRASVSVQSAIRNPQSAIDPDLDWIVLKCLEKDRNRRYATANGLASDLQRYLSDEPIVARPPSKLYEFQKTVRRHKVGFVATAAVLLALAAGVAVSLWQAWRAEQSRQTAEANEQKARTEAARSQQVAQFLKEMLETADPEIAWGRDTTLLRNILDQAAERVGRELKDQPRVEAELRIMIGQTYFSLGDYRKAAEMRREALRLRRTEFGETNLLVAASLEQLGLALDQLDDFSGAETMHRAALAAQRALSRAEDSGADGALIGLAEMLTKQGRLAEAETLTRELITRDRSLRYLYGLGAVLTRRGNLAEAEAIIRQALAMALHGGGGPPGDVPGEVQRLGLVLLRQGRWSEAEALFREALAIRQTVYGSEHRQAASPLHGLAVALGHQGKLAEAETIWREGLAIQRQALGDEHLGLCHFLSGLAITLRAQGQTAEAEATYAKMLALRKKLATEAEQRGDLEALNELAWLLATSTDAAVRDGPRAVLLAEKTATMADRKNPVFLATLAAAYAEVGRFTEAVSVQREAISATVEEQQKEELERRLTLFAASAPCRETSLNSAAAALLATAVGDLLNGENPAAVEKLHRDRLASLSNAPAAEHAARPYALQCLAVVLQAQGKTAEAETTYREMLAGLKRAETEGAHRALVDWRKRVATTPDNAEALNDLAWLMATSPEASVRDGPEAMVLAEKAVALTNRVDPDILDTFAAACAEAGHFEEAVRLQQEAIARLNNRSQRKNFEMHLRLFMDKKPYRQPSSSQAAVGILDTVPATRPKRERFAEAEPLARECLAIREQEQPEQWVTFESRSLLGACLLGQKKYAEAEPLLRSGYEGLKQREEKIPASGKARLHEAGERLVQLYEAWSKPDEAAAWRMKLPARATNLDNPRP